MKKHNLVIDGTMILYSSLAVNKDDYLNTGEYIGGVTGTIRQISGFINKFIPDDVYVTFDEDKSKYRLDMYSGYKAGRHLNVKDEDLAFRFSCKTLHLTYLKLLLPMLGVKVITVPEVEADDIIANFVEQSKRNNTIISTDKDFIQLINKHVNLYRPVTDQLITYKDVENFLGYSKEYIIPVKIMNGDKSDNIPGIKGVGDKTAVKIITEAGCSKDQILEWATNIEKHRFKTDIIDFITSGKWDLNDKLMNLKHGPKFEVKDFIHPTDCDIYMAHDMLTELGISDFMLDEDIDRLLEPFLIWC